jgi:hypothetical protein
MKSLQKIEKKNCGNENRGIIIMIIMRNSSDVHVVFIPLVVMALKIKINKTDVIVMIVNYVIMECGCVICCRDMKKCMIKRCIGIITRREPIRNVICIFLSFCMLNKSIMCKKNKVM